MSNSPEPPPKGPKPVPEASVESITEDQEGSDEEKEDE